MKEKVTGSDSTLDIFKVTQHDRSFLRVYYCKEKQTDRDREREREGEGKKERENFKVQELFADVQIHSKSLRGPEGTQMLFD